LQKKCSHLTKTVYFHGQKPVYLKGNFREESKKKKRSLTGPVIVHDTSVEEVDTSVCWKRV